MYRLKRMSALAAAGTYVARWYYGADALAGTATEAEAAAFDLGQYPASERRAAIGRALDRECLHHVSVDDVDRSVGEVARRLVREGRV